MFSLSITSRFVSGSKTIMKSPKRMMVTTNYDQEELMDKGSSFFSPRSLFSSHNDDSSQVLDSSHFTYENSEQGLLLDIPSNGSFPQAELLLPISSFDAQASTSSSSVYPYFVRRTWWETSNIFYSCGDQGLFFITILVEYWVVNFCVILAFARKSTLKMRFEATFFPCIYRLTKIVYIAQKGGDVVVLSSIWC